ncbi:MULTISPECIES: HAD family hydrolase [unclassified Psychrobacillus]|uniref:HAD-IIB family hydrolase n=1 Tax=unclassified Psychrobacillus TaxID=2636677 RepID=UPI00146EDB86|nr:MULTISPECIES: HAD family hydrolase [unclassified Psychrobacillus]MCM3357913.1 Cof-type HAD-IIB family hydrolase [Psychrobacillus sp. MER TA 171]NME05285.1 HAD family phosphatase [Psychrobacillus sp. BL-248-WT-3]
MKFIFDLDGTICFQGKPLSNAMVQALEELLEKGHEVILASARPIRDLLPILPRHFYQLPMVGGNGAFVAKEGQIISSTHFDKQTSEKIIQLIEKYKAQYLVDSEWDYAYTGDENHPIRMNLDTLQQAEKVELHKLNKVVKVVILHSNNQENLLHELKQLPVEICNHGREGILDISPLGVDKWNGLQKLGVLSKQFIAFGNDANDIPMFLQAQSSVCIGNYEELIKIATAQVANEEALVLNKLKEIAKEL